MLLSDFFTTLAESESRGSSIWFIIILTSIFSSLFARRILGSNYKKSYDRPLDFQEVRLSDYPKASKEFYNDRLDEAMGLGMNHVTDYVDKKGINGTNKVPVRVFASPAGDVIMAVYHYPIPVWNRLVVRTSGLKTIEAETLFDNGEFVATSNAKLISHIEGMEWQNKELVAADSTLEAILARHRKRVGEYMALYPGVKPVPVRTAEEVFAMQEQQHNRIVEVWRSKGWKFSKMDLKMQQNGTPRVVLTEELIGGQSASFTDQQAAAGAPAAAAEKDAPVREWYYSLHGQNNGPLSKEELKEAVWKPGMNPRSTLVWSPSMDQWKPLTDVPELRPEKQAQETLSPMPQTMNPYQAPAVAEARLGRELAAAHQLEYSGLQRKGFAIWMLVVLPLVYLLEFYLESAIETTGFATTIRWIGIFAFVFVMSARLKNLGMNGNWFFGLLVPGLNLWLYYRSYCCPQGYDDHGTMDGPGKVLRVVYWSITGLLILALVGFLALVFFWMPELLDHLLDSDEEWSDYMDESEYDYMDDSFPEPAELPATE